MQQLIDFSIPSIDLTQPPETFMTPKNKSTKRGARYQDLIHTPHSMRIKAEKDEEEHQERLEQHEMSKVLLEYEQDTFQSIKKPCKEYDLDYFQTPINKQNNICQTVKKPFSSRYSMNFDTLTQIKDKFQQSQKKLISMSCKLEFNPQNKVQQQQEEEKTLRQLFQQFFCSFNSQSPEILNFFDEQGSIDILGTEQQPLKSTIYTLSTTVCNLNLIHNHPITIEQDNSICFPKIHMLSCRGSAQLAKDQSKFTNFLVSMKIKGLNKIQQIRFKFDN